MSRLTEAGKPRKRAGATKRAKREPTASEQEAKRLMDRAKRMRRSAPHLLAAQEELRQHVANWIIAIRSRIVGLTREVSEVLQATRDGEVLSGLFDHRLNDLSVDLDAADCTAAGLHVDGYDVPIPALLVMRDSVCKRFPLAAEGAALFAKKGGA